MAERARAAVRLHVPDLIIADVELPGMDGVTLLRTLRHEQNEVVARIPVIMLIGPRKRHLRQQALEAGANAVLDKPIRPMALIEDVGKLLPPGSER